MDLSVGPKTKLRKIF